jgi:hypothetical protein
MAIGITLVQTGHTVGEPIAAVGSITVLLDALFFDFRGNATKISL